MYTQVQKLKAIYGIQDNQIYVSPITGTVYVNLCPHGLTLKQWDDSIFTFEQPSEDAVVARIKQDSMGMMSDLDGFVIHKFRTHPPMLYRNVRNKYIDEKPFPLECFSHSVFFIVSFAVQESLKRPDVLAPHAIEFDSSNRATMWQLKELV